MTPQRRQGGAALLTAILLAGLTALLVSAMLWQAWGGLSQQQAARQADQADWILRGAIDWAQLILQDNARSSNVDTLSQPWATPLAETDLAEFMAVRGRDAAELSQAWIAGGMRDAQSRFNVLNLAPNGQPDPAALSVLLRLCGQLGVEPAVATQLVEAVEQSRASAAVPPPHRFSDLQRLAPKLAPLLPRLQREMTLLPQPTPVNANTADATLLAAELGVSADAAALLVQQRDKLGGFRNLGDLKSMLGPASNLVPNASQLGVGSNYFDVLVRVRLGDFGAARQALVQRLGTRTRVLLVQPLAPWQVDAAFAPPPA